MKFLGVTFVLITGVLVAVAFFPVSLLVLLLCLVPAGILLRSSAKRFNLAVVAHLTERGFNPGEIDGVFVQGSVHRRPKFVIVFADRLSVGTRSTQEVVPFRSIERLGISQGIGVASFNLHLTDGTTKRIQIGQAADPFGLVQAIEDHPEHQQLLGPTTGFLAATKGRERPPGQVDFTDLMRSRQVAVGEDKALTRADNWRFAAVALFAVVYLFVGGAFLAVLSE